MKSGSRWSSIGFASSVLALGFASKAAQGPNFTPPTPQQAAFFEARVRPIFADNCLSCHGATNSLGGLKLDSRANVIKGGNSGPAIVPGEPDKSLLIQAVRQVGSLKMPQGGKLAANQVADLETWVKMGAPWPDSPESKGKQYDFLWSLQPVRKPSPPTVQNKAWIKQPIDAFVLAGLEAKKLKPVPPADKHTLLRRVTYDLTGLPPTPAEMDAFLADNSPGAYVKVVDRLLASPRYGERWARHWLDVARYADTKGYVFEEDRNYYNAYTYRDWVISAFNRDLPFNKFVVDQLAADRVLVGDDRRDLAALGFLTVGRRFLNYQPDIIDDRIDVTMRGFEGFTVECARCHDHKFDPIPTQDYYSLYAVFNSSQESEIAISDKAIREPWEAYSARVAALGEQIRELTLAQTKRLRGLSDLGPEVKRVLQDLGEGRAPEGDRLAKLTPAFEPAEQDRLKKLQSDLAQLEKDAPAKPEFAMAMVDKPNPSDGVVFKRGKPGNNGEPAPRRFLKALCSGERPLWTKDSGRLELAEAIASKENPLTARVFVNRVWQDHFGAGIVRTPSDFGHQGERPTNQELLDYLAWSFMENGWSVKKLQKMIVTSATYCQSSVASPAAVNADPENRLMSRSNLRRLDLEQMRDSLMLAAGKLDTSQVGGKSVDLWSAPYSPRRAVYGYVERQNLPGIFRTFDFASPDSTSARRFFTTVPQQALFFMNSPFVIDQARALAGRVASADNGQKVRQLYRLLFQRQPSAQEASAALAYLKSGPSQVASGDPWSYGYGEFAGGKVSFTPLTEFAGGSYRAGAAMPDPVLGYVSLSAQGGHPGHDAAHAVIRRWTAPVSGVVQVSGTLGHRQAQGDGVRGRLVSSRSGLVGEWRAHNGQVATSASVTVQKGDTLDFVVDPLTGDAYDSFAWSPTVRSADGKSTWDAAAEFAPPLGEALTRLVLYAQALMMTNEFMFVD